MHTHDIKIPATIKAIEPLMRFSRTVELLTRFSVHTTVNVPSAAIQPGIIGRHLSQQAMVVKHYQVSAGLSLWLDKINRMQPAALTKLP